MSRHWMLVGFLSLSLSCLGQSAFAQTRGTTGNASAGSYGGLQQSANSFGNSNTGFGNTGNTGFGNTGFGNTGTSNTGMGANNSAFGNTTRLSNSNSQNSRLSNLNANGQTQSNTGTSTNGMTNSNAMGTNQGSFGNNQQSMFGNQQNQFGNNLQNQFGRNATRNALGGGRSAFGQFGNFNQFNFGNQQQQGTIQPSLSLGFKPPMRAPEQVTESVGARMQNVATRPVSRGLARPELKGVAAASSGEGVLTLSGKVPTPEARRLAENLARFEPGVRKVVNQLEVEAVQ